MIYANKNNGLCYETNVFEEDEAISLDVDISDANFYCVCGDEIVSVFTKTIGRTFPLVRIKDEL